MLLSLLNLNRGRFTITTSCRPSRRDRSNKKGWIQHTHCRLERQGRWQGIPNLQNAVKSLRVSPTHMPARGRPCQHYCGSALHVAETGAEPVPPHRTRPSRKAQRVGQPCPELPDPQGRRAQHCRCPQLKRDEPRSRTAGIVGAHRPPPRLVKHVLLYRELVQLRGAESS